MPRSSHITPADDDSGPTRPSVARRSLAGFGRTSRTAARERDPRRGSIVQTGRQIVGLQSYEASSKTVAKRKEKARLMRDKLSAKNTLLMQRRYKWEAVNEANFVSGGHGDGHGGHGAGGGDSSHGLGGGDGHAAHGHGGVGGGVAAGFGGGGLTPRSGGQGSSSSHGSHGAAGVGSHGGSHIAGAGEGQSSMLSMMAKRDTLSLDVITGTSWKNIFVQMCFAVFLGVCIGVCNALFTALEMSVHASMGNLAEAYGRTTSFFGQDTASTDSPASPSGVSLSALHPERHREMGSGFYISWAIAITISSTFLIIFVKKYFPSCAS